MIESVLVTVTVTGDGLARRGGQAARADVDAHGQPAVPAGGRLTGMVAPWPGVRWTRAVWLT